MSIIKQPMGKYLERYSDCNALHSDVKVKVTFFPVLELASALQSQCCCWY